MANNDNIIYAKFNHGREITTDSRSQYAYGQVLKISGLHLPTSFDADISNKGDKQAKAIIGTDNELPIDDAFFLSGKDVIVMINVHAADKDGRTKYIIRIPVEKRPERADIELEPVQQDVISVAIATLNEAVEQTSASAESAENSANRAHESAVNAETSATSASNSEVLAQQYMERAEIAAENAEQSKTKAKTSEDNAKASETHAEQIATEIEQYTERAETASTNAQSSASTATQKATEASAFANIATTKANEASTSATNAQNSANNAQQSATDAQESANSASASASRALVNAEKTQNDKEIVELAKFNVLSAVSEAQTYATTAQSASQAIQDMNVEAVTLGVDSNVTVEKSVDPVTGAVTLTYGIPKGVKGEKGDTGSKGDKGDPFVYSDFTPEQLASLKGEKGDKGDAFEYSDFTPQQLASLKGDKGDKGDAFEYSDFTPEQLASLKGEKGDTGNTGAKGDTGNSGVYVGTSAPSDTNVNVWIDSDGTSDFGLGVPPTAQTVAEMDETESSIWIYTGSEPGYIVGNWYYYNGSTWVSGGVYGAGVTDSVPTQSSSNAVSSGGVYSVTSALRDDVDALQTGLEEVYTGKQVKTSTINKLDRTTLTDDCYVNKHYELIENTNHKTTDYIPLDGTTKTGFCFTRWNSERTARISSSLRSFAFYDANKNPVGWNGSTQTHSFNAFIADAVYIRISAENNYFTMEPMVEFVDSIEEISTEYVEHEEIETVTHGLNYLDAKQQEILGDVADLQEDVSGLSTSITALGTSVDALTDKISSVKSDNLFSTYTQRAYWKSDGTQVTNDSWIATDGIDVSAYDTITYENAGTPGSTPCCLWTDSSDDVISHFFQKSAGETLDVPEGAKYVKFSLRQEQKNTFSVIGERVSQIDANADVIKRISESSKDVSAIATFANGGINTNAGTYNASYTWKVATPSITTIPDDYTLRIADGYRLYIVEFENGTKKDGYWVGLSTVTLKAGATVRLMIAETNESGSGTADVDAFCGAIQCDLSVNVNNLWQEVEDVSTTIKNINPVNTIGQTWDWWISANSVDAYGSAYIGYVDSEGYAGVLRKQPDGTIQYKRLEKLSNNDDHNGCATIVLDDGRILVVGSYGHSASNYFICWRSTKPHSIDDMEKLSFSIPQSTYTYRTTYSQLFKYDGKIFDFFRIVTYSGGTVSGGGYACNISTDNGTTWTTYKVFNGTDGYQAIAQCTDDAKYLKIISAINPASGNNVFRGCYIDLSTYKAFDLSGVEIGEMIPLNGGTMADDSIAQKSDMTELVTQTADGLQGRLFFCAKTPLSETVFVYATAKTTALNDFTYKRYNDGQVTEVGSSGVGFGNVSYLSGMCIGNSPDTLYYSKASTAKADGNHELHKVKISNNVVASDEIITEASMCILRPLFLGNGELATVVGHYNDQNSDGTYNGSFTAWELKPMFTRA